MEALFKNLFNVFSEEIEVYWGNRNSYEAVLGMINQKLNYLHREYSNVLCLGVNKCFVEGEEVLYIRVQTDFGKIEFSKTGAIAAAEEGKLVTWSSKETIKKWAEKEGVYPAALTPKNFHNMISLYLGIAGFEGFCQNPKLFLHPRIGVFKLGYQEIWKTPFLNQIKKDKSYVIPVSPSPNILVGNLVFIREGEEGQSSSISSSSWTVNKVMDDSFRLISSKALLFSDFVPVEAKLYKFEPETGLAILMGLIARDPVHANLISEFEKIPPFGFKVSFWFQAVQTRSLDPILDIEENFRLSGCKLKDGFFHSDNFPPQSKEDVGIIFETLSTESIGVRFYFEHNVPKDILVQIKSLETDCSLKRVRTGNLHEVDGVDYLIEFSDFYTLAYKFCTLDIRENAKPAIRIKMDGELGPFLTSSDIHFPENLDENESFFHLE